MSEIRLDVVLKPEEAQRAEVLQRLYDAIREVGEEFGIKPEIMKRESATLDEIQAAREEFNDDVCSIDPDAMVSHAEQGTWVQGWLWIGKAGWSDQQQIAYLESQGWFATEEDAWRHKDWGPDEIGYATLEEAFEAEIEMNG